MGLLKSIYISLTDRSSDKTSKIKIIEIPRWVLDFIPKQFSDYIKQKDCLNINININELKKYKKDDVVGKSVFINFQFDRLNNENPEELINLLDINKIEEQIKVKIIQSCKKYNDSKNKKYLIKNYKTFQTYVSCDKTKRKYQLSLRLFT